MNKKRMIALINAEAATELAAAAVRAGHERGISISVSVTDAFANEIAFLKADGATQHSSATSRKKARTAASTRRQTGWMSSDLAITLPLASDNFLTNIPGGFPVELDGTVIGAIGVAGGTVEQDAEVAHAALMASGFCP